jgi:hypothetical protein
MTDFSFVYESLLLTAEVDNTFEIAITEESGMDGFLMSADTANGSAQVRVANQGTGFILRQRIAHTDLLLSGALNLGVPGRSLSLGPNVSVEVGEAVFHSTDIRVLGGDSSVVIQAEKIVPSHGFTKLSCRSGTLHVLSTEAPWPFSEHVQVAPPLHSEDAEDYGIMLFACRILGRFSGTAIEDGLRRGKLLINNVAVGQSSLARQVRDFLLHDALIVDVSPRFYQLSIGRLGERGISFSDISQRNFREPFEKLAKDFYAWRTASSGGQSSTLNCQS